MSKKTDNLGLELTISGTTTFEEWRKSINGDNDGTIIELSNMQIIDNEIGELKEIVEEVRVDIKTAIEDRGVEVGDIPFNEYHLKIAEIEGSGGSVTDSGSSNWLTGWTMPLTWKNAPSNEREFYLKSDKGNITITGLNDYATITGNGTKNVSFNITENGDNNMIIPFVISINDSVKTYNQVGRVFYCGTEVNEGNCLAVASLIMPNDFGAGELGVNFDIIESSSLPYFSSNTSTWNNYYAHQLVSFKKAKSSLETVGNSFMSICYAFNQPLDLSSVTQIGNLFMGGCYAFNQPLDLSSVTQIGNDFMNTCYAFNQPLDLSSLETVGNDYFMRGCSAFNQPLDLSSLTQIGRAFMQDCYAFNQPLDLSSLETVGNSFMNSCRAFNQPLDLSSVTQIGDIFIYGLSAFNQPLDLSSVTQIGNTFMSNCMAFNQPLDLSSLETVGNSFMKDCYALTLLEWNVDVFPTDNNSLSQTMNTKTSLNGTGIKIIGTHATGLKSALPDRTSSPFRKLVL